MKGCSIKFRFLLYILILFFNTIFNSSINARPLDLGVLTRIFDEDCPFKEIFSSYSYAWQEIKKAYDMYFNGNDDETWTSFLLSNKTISEKLLGYDLKLEYIGNKDQKMGEEVTLYLHGWGDTKNSARLFKKLCGVLPGNIITFNFADARPIIGKLNYSNFGQFYDVYSALYAAYQSVKKFQLKKLNLFGISRGGGTIITMLALLNNDALFEQNKEALEKIDIDEQVRIELLTAIQSGTIVLDIPLRSIRHTPMPNYILNNMTLYDVNNWEPLQMAELLQGLKLTMLIHFQHADAILTDKEEAEFFYALAKHNPMTTFLVVGNDGGHAHTHASLSKTIQDFHAQILEKIKIIHDRSEYIENGILIRFEQPTLSLIKNLLVDYHDRQKQ